MTDTTTGTASGASVREVPLADGGTLELVLTSNDLRLRGVDGDRVVVRARDLRDLADELSIETSPGRVVIRDRGNGELRFGPLRIGSRQAVNLDVDVPRGTRLSVRTLSGDVSAQAIAGPSRWATASGDLRLQVDGGPVDVDTMSGDVTLEASVAIEVGARSVSGDLRLRAPSLLVLNASTTSGDVDVVAEMAGPASHAISSVSGDVRLTTGSEVRLEAQTVSGDIRAAGAHREEGGRGRRTLVVGAGKVAVKARTMSGDILLRPGAGPARSAPPAPQAGSAAPDAPVDPVTPVAAPDPAVVVAEASAAPNLVRPGLATPADPASGGAGDEGPREAARLELLHALERGDLDVETAMRRLETLDGGGPRPFRGWS